MPFEKNVFINCPFDPEYIDDLLKPMLYSLVKNGFVPRLSLEVSDSGEVRLEKITDIIKACKFSIHDLSIVKSKKGKEFARMNMPFELGIDYGLRRSGVKPFDEKKFLILEATKYDYQKALSDINGFDIKVHSNNTEKIFENLYSWTSETLLLHGQDPPLKTYYDFIDFNASLYDEKLVQFGEEKFAMSFISNISIPEYIKEIQQRV
jgi:hypothetical protein